MLPYSSCACNGLGAILQLTFMPNHTYMQHVKTLHPDKRLRGSVAGKRDQRQGRIITGLGPA